MNKTKIEWCDYTINPVKGLCPMACPYCYASRMYKRYHWDETIRFDWSVANDVAKMRPGSKVFWGSTMELFGGWVKPEWRELMFNYIREYCKDQIHIFLTKKSENLIKWSPFPANCWVGVSATEPDMIRKAFKNIKPVEANVKFISFEPLQGMLFTEGMNIIENFIRDSGVNWVIIGQKTPVSKKTQPKIEWIKEIVDAADKAGIPVFLKDNLYDLLPFEDRYWTDTSHLRQEFPRAGK